MKNNLKDIAEEQEPFVFSVTPENLVHACQRAINSGYEHLSLITAVDWKDKWEIVYHLVQYGSPDVLTLTVILPYDNPVVPSLTHVWPAADWHERETYDLMGIHFEGHPDLKRILLPKEYGEHPLRKEVLHGNRS